jgi:hypothetical protein
LANTQLDLVLSPNVCEAISKILKKILNLQFFFLTFFVLFATSYLLIKMQVIWLVFAILGAFLSKN